MKKHLRQEINVRRQKLNLLEVQSKSHDITYFVVTSDLFKQAKTIMIYLPIKNEVQTEAIIETAWQLGKKVCIPVCQPNFKEIIPSMLIEWKDVTKGTFGILEPTAENIRSIPKEEIDIIFVPGVVFDRAGNRVGFGAGYYDKFLPKLRKEAAIIALAYDFQIVDSIPAEEHDVAMDYIITEEGISDCALVSMMP